MSELVRADREVHHHEHVVNDNAVVAQEQSSAFSDSFMKNPLVPLGIAATLYAVVKGVKGAERSKAQYYMRLRVGAQLGTVFALMAGAVYFTGASQVGEEVKDVFGTPSTWWRRVRNKFTRSQ